MAFISAADEVVKKSVTLVHNKFITKYMPVLEPTSVKVYLYSLFVYQSGQGNFTLSDFAAKLNTDEETVINCFEHLEDFELVKITSIAPFEVTILDCENVSGTPKKRNPEKYSGLFLEIQSIISGRMVSTNEYDQYITFLEEYGFERNALLMIVSDCVKCTDNKVRFNYIKNRLISYANEGVTTSSLVEEKIAAIEAREKLLKDILKICGLKREIVTADRTKLKQWKLWNFSDEMLFKAAEISKDKKSPLSYMNSVLSLWKDEGVFTPEAIPEERSADLKKNGKLSGKAAQRERDISILKELYDEFAEADDGE